MPCGPFHEIGIRGPWCREAANDGQFVGAAAAAVRPCHYLVESGPSRTIAGNVLTALGGGMENVRRPIVALDFDSKLLPADLRFDAWCRALSSFDLSRRETAPFDAVARVWMLGPLVVSRASVDPLRYDRPSRRVAADANDHYALVYLLSGGFDGDYGAGVITSGPGSLTVLDMRRPFWTDATRLDAFVLSMSRTLLVPHIGRIDPHGLVTDRGAGALLGAMLGQLAVKVDGLTQRHAPMLTSIVRDLVTQTIIDGDHDDGAAAASSRNDTLLQRVQEYVDAHLADDLSASMICDAVGASRSALYRAFDDTGGVQQEIQRRRLRRLRALLADPAEIRSIAQIGRSLGFADASHVTRLFKKEFGRTPGDYRRARTSYHDLALDADADAPRVFDHWIRLLE